MARSFLLLGFLLLSCSLTRKTPAEAAEAQSAVTAASGDVSAGGGRGRMLLGYKENQGNVSFQCSPSGPCIPCQYSEKNDEKYRCSETGYRVPLKCIEIQDSPKEKTDSKNQRKLYSKQGHDLNAAVHKQLPAAIRKLEWRRLLDDSSTSEDGKRGYITYRSCVPVDGEEKLSVLGFEMIMVGLLLISGPVVYTRQKRSFVMPGVGALRIPSNSPRF